MLLLNENRVFHCMTIRRNDNVEATFCYLFRMLFLCEQYNAANARNIGQSNPLSRRPAVDYCPGLVNRGKTEDNSERFCIVRSQFAISWEQ